MKRIIALIAAALMLLCTVNVFAEDITVNVNGEAVEFDQQPVVEEGVLLLPFRFIAEKFGANVQWFEDSDGLPIRQVLCQLGEDISIMQIGNANIFVNSAPVTLSEAPKIIGDRTLVTAEAVEAVTGAKVTFDEINLVVNIVK